MLTRNLPPVRVKIWKLTFVKRHVELDLYPYYRATLGMGVGKKTTDKPPEPYVPATLAVNRESRGETLREYYAIYIPSSCLDHATREYMDELQLRKYSPGWVNPSLDSVFIREPPAVTERLLYSKWFNHIKECIPAQAFSKIRQLEVRHMWWDPTGKFRKEQLGVLISHFPGLKTVLLTGDGIVDFVPTDKQLEGMREDVERAVETHKDIFVGGVAPVVKARQHEDLYTGEQAFD
jgi:hypothetical protein